MVSHHCEGILCTGWREGGRWSERGGPPAERGGVSLPKLRPLSLLQGQGLVFAVSNESTSCVCILHLVCVYFILCLYTSSCVCILHLVCVYILHHSYSGSLNPNLYNIIFVQINCLVGLIILNVHNGKKPGNKTNDTVDT